MDWRIPNQFRKIFSRGRDSTDSSSAVKPVVRKISDEVTYITPREVIARLDRNSSRTQGIPEPPTADDGSGSQDHSNNTASSGDAVGPAWYQQAWSFASKLPGQAAGSVREAYDGSRLQHTLNYDLMNIPRGIGKGIGSGFSWAAGGIGAGLGAAGGGIGKGINNFREWGGRGNPYTLKNWHRVGLFLGGVGAVGGGIAAVDYVLGLKDEVQEAHADADYAEEALARVQKSIDGLAWQLGEPLPTRGGDGGLDAADYVGSFPKDGLVIGFVNDIGASPDGKATAAHHDLVVDLRDYGERTIAQLIEEVLDCRDLNRLYTPWEIGMPSAAECANTLVNVRTPDGGTLQLTLGDLLDQYHDVYGQPPLGETDAAGIPDYVERSALTVADCADVPVDKGTTIDDVIAEGARGYAPRDAAGQPTASPALEPAAEAAAEPTAEATAEKLYSSTLVDVQTPDGGTLQLRLGDLVDQFEYLSDPNLYIEKSGLTAADCQDVFVGNDQTLGELLAEVEVGKTLQPTASPVPEPAAEAVAEPTAAECYEKVIVVRTPESTLQLKLGDVVQRYATYAAAEKASESSLSEAVCREVYPCPSSEGSVEQIPNFPDTSSGPTRVGGEESVTGEDQVDGSEYYSEDDLGFAPDTCGYLGLKGPEPNRTLEEACFMERYEPAVPLPAPTHCGGDYGGRAERTLVDACTTEPTKFPTNCGEAGYSAKNAGVTLEAVCNYDAPGTGPALPGQGDATTVGAAVTPSQDDVAIPREEDDGRICLDEPLQNTWYTAIETIRTTLPSRQQLQGFEQLYGQIMQAVTAEGARVFTRGQLYNELVGDVFAHPELYGLGRRDVTANRAFFEKKLGQLRGYGPGKTFMIGGEAQLQEVDGLLIQRGEEKP